MPFRRWKAARTETGAPSRQAIDILDRLGGRLQYPARSIDACVCEPR
jgi:hypothetical protein